MSDRIETVVVVTDRGSATFAKVGTSVQKMGKQIDTAGQSGAVCAGTLSAQRGGAGERPR